METRCSILAAERAEPMAGTAFQQGGLLLVEQPGAWGRAGLAESGFDRDVALALEQRAADHDLRLLAIRRLQRTVPGRRAWAVRPPGSALTTWSEYDADADLLDVPLDGSAGMASTRPSYLVCTHARRDQCCAVFARPLALALEALRPGEVWGCSHTGGHRFAPVVVALPVGRPGTVVYGRVAPDDLSALVTATEDGRVLVDRLRGLAGHPPQVQAALRDVMAHPGPAGIGDWQPVRVTGDLESGWEVELQGPVGSRLVRVTASETAEPFVSCGKPGPESQRHYAVSRERPLRG